jgi:hypothetical protein
MMLIILVSSLAIVASCGGTLPLATATPSTSVAVAKPDPHAQLEYPGTFAAGVLSNSVSRPGVYDLISMTISNDAVDTVRAFYMRPLDSFERLGGNATEETPLHLRSASARHDLFIAVYAQNGVTMIRTATLSH